MAAIDATLQLALLSSWVGQDQTLAANYVVRLTNVHRSGPAANSLVMTGTITKDGVEHLFDNSNPIIWTNPKASPSILTNTQLATDFFLGPVP